MEKPILELYQYDQAKASNFIDENIIQHLPGDVQRVFLQQLGISPVTIGISYTQHPDNHKLAMKFLLDEFFIQNDGTFLQLVNGLMCDTVRSIESESTKMRQLVNTLVQNAKRKIPPDSLSSKGPQSSEGN